MKNKIEKSLTKDWQNTRDIYDKLIKKTDEYSMKRLIKTLHKMYKYQEIDKIIAPEGGYRYVWRLKK